MIEAIKNIDLIFAREQESFGHLLKLGGAHRAYQNSGECLTCVYTGMKAQKISLGSRRRQVQDHPPKQRKL